MKTLFGDRRRFANFFFGWQLDSKRTRLLFYTIPDINGRNIQRLTRYINGKYIHHLIRYPRWVEEGYRNELMRLTDFMNSLPLDMRENLIELTKLKPMKPSEELLIDLWNLAKANMSNKELYRKYHEGYYEVLRLW
jgi:hypothetical protein